MRIAISGAGVAGAALAHWLHRAGHTPTLIEQAPRFGTGGYMIDFWGVGYQVARRMGSEPQILDAGYDVRCVRSVGPDGRARAELGVEVFRRMVGEGFTRLPRGDLAAAIYSTVEGQVEALYGDSIASIDQHDGGASVTFDHSAPREFDLVVGADGLHTSVRRLIFGPDDDYEHYLGCKVAAFVVDGYRPRDELVYVTYNTPGRQVGRFALRDDRTMFLFVFRAEHGSGASPKKHLRNEFGDAGWECRDILAALDGVDDLYFDVVHRRQAGRYRAPHWPLCHADAIRSVVSRPGNAHNELRSGGRSVLRECPRRHRATRLHLLIRARRSPREIAIPPQARRVARRRARSPQERHFRPLPLV